MADIQFEDQDQEIAERNKVVAQARKEGHPGSIATDILIRINLAQNEKQANYILLGVSIILLVLTGTLVFNESRPIYRGEPTPLEAIAPETREELPPETIEALSNTRE